MVFDIIEHLQIRPELKESILEFRLCCHVFNRDKGHLIGIAVFNTAFHHNGFTHSVRVPVANYEGKRFNSIDCCNYQLFLN